MAAYCSRAPSGCLNRSTSSTRTSVRSAIIGMASMASAKAWGVQSSAEKRWQLNSPAGPSAIFFVMRST